MRASCDSTSRARTIAKRSISVRWSAVSPASSGGPESRRPRSRPAPCRARCGRPPAWPASESTSRRQLRSRSGGARPGVHHAQLDGARVDRAHRQRTGHGPQPEGGRSIRRHVEPRPRRPTTVPLGEAERQILQRAESTSVRASSSNPASMPAAPRASLRTCSSPAGTDPVPIRAVRASSTCGSGSSSRSAAPTAPASTPACARNASNCSDVMPRLLASRATPTRSRPGAAAPGRALHPTGAPRSRPAARRAAASAPARAACRGGCARTP